MRTLCYGFFGEDAGQRAFLAAYLPHCGGHAVGIGFEAVPYFGKAFGPMNNKVVDRRCSDACREAFVVCYPRLDWLFVGRDVDSFEAVRHQFLQDKLRASIPDKWQDRTLLMLPVQCIEHWMLYLAQYPNRTAIEHRPNDQAKELVYADRNKSREAITNEITGTLNSDRIAWLLEVSISFRVFHQQVGAYLANLPQAG